MKQKEEEERKKAEINKNLKQQTKSKIELGKLKKQSMNQAKANMVRLEKTVWKFSVKITTHKKGHSRDSSTGKARRVPEKVQQEKGNPGKREGSLGEKAARNGGAT